MSLKKETIKKEVDNEDSCYLWPLLFSEYCWCHQKYVIIHLIHLTITFQRKKSWHQAEEKFECKAKKVLLNNDVIENNADVIVLIT